MKKSPLALFKQRKLQHFDEGGPVEEMYYDEPTQSVASAIADDVSSGSLSEIALTQWANNLEAGLSPTGATAGATNSDSLLMSILNNQGQGTNSIAGLDNLGALIQALSAQEAGGATMGIAPTAAVDSWGRAIEPSTAPTPAGVAKQVNTQKTADTSTTSYTATKENAAALAAEVAAGRMKWDADTNTYSPVAKPEVTWKSMLDELGTPKGIAGIAGALGSLYFANQTNARNQDATDANNQARVGALNNYTTSLARPAKYSAPYASMTPAATSAITLTPRPRTV